MDSIDKAIEQKKHISDQQLLNEQTWEQFEQVSVNKKIFLFGTGVCADYFWYRYRGKLALSGVIDNDPVKQTFRLGDIVAEAFHTDEHNMKICKKEILKQYPAQQIVILIASIHFYVPIIRELKAMGITDCFSILVMEANLRLHDHVTSDNDINRRADYALSCCQLPVKKKKLFFWAFNRFTDHGKYITEQLLRIRSDLDIVWVIHNLKEKLPENIRIVYAPNWKQYIYEMETAHIWIFNAVFPAWIIKRPGQLFIETKHWASITLKKFYLDSSTITDIPQDVALWKYNSSCMDYIITGSDFDTASCRRGFQFHKEVLQIGSPRSDAMFQESEKKEKVYRCFHLEENSKILLYAPTYRYQKNAAVHRAEIRNIDMDYDSVKRALEQRFGGNWYIMLRLHPGQEKEIVKLKLPEYIIDASTYEDGQETVAASDILISDYSSIMFEPAFVKKPVFLFATDKNEYIDKEYDLLIDYDSLPFPIALSNQELVHNILHYDQEAYEKRLEEFMDHYGIHEDGHASERAAAFVSTLIDNG